MKNSFNSSKPLKDSLKANPLGLGILRNVSGLIPAGDRNPEIFYTSEAESVAAVTLLTFLLIKPEIVAQVKAQDTKFVCSDLIDDMSEQIGRNIIENLPPTHIRTSRHQVRPDNKNFGKSVGLNFAAGKLVNIYRKSQHQASKEVSLEHRFLNSIFSSSLSEDDNAFKSAADSLHERLPDLESRLTLADVFDCRDDAHLKVLMGAVAKGQYGKSLTNIPRVVCHEIGHNMMVESLIAGDGLSLQCDIAELNAKLSSPFPSIIMKLKSPSVGRKIFEKIFLAADLKQMSKEDRKRYSYYYNDIVETKAELFGSALVDEMNDRHGLSVHTSGFGKCLVVSYPLVRRIIDQLTPSSVRPGVEIGSPERQMEPHTEWASNKMYIK